MRHLPKTSRCDSENSYKNIHEFGRFLQIFLKKINIHKNLIHELDKRRRKNKMKREKLVRENRKNEEEKLSWN